MCDTLVALASATVDGSIYFAKNSDREPNEAQSIVRIKPADYPDGSVLHCTYISIPQATHTNGVLLSKPFWIWGAEMGANDHGVVIGNEAVFTKIPQEKEPGLIGMDLLRLGLERSDTAYEALQMITTLLQKYGQSGNCGYQHTMVYHNSFLICDKQEAWVLETAGRQWAAQRVQGIRSISNCLSIRKTWDLASDDLVAYAIDKKWCSSRADFDFAGCYSDYIYTTFSDSKNRNACSMNALSAHEGSITLQQMMAYLRMHGRKVNGPWQPGKGITGADVCMHAGWGPIRGSQTTASLVAHFHKDQPDTYWCTRGAAPCTGIFLPTWLDSYDPDGIHEPKGDYQAGFDFWDHEVLHRSVLLDYEKRMSIYISERNTLEDKFISKAYANIKKNAQQRELISTQMLEEVRTYRQSWIEKVQGSVIERRKQRLFQSAWEKHNQACNINAIIK
jgi:secernin